MSVSVFLSATFQVLGGVLRFACARHVATRIAIATTVGIPASMLVIQRRIYFLVRRSSTNQTTALVRFRPTSSVWSSGSTELIIHFAIV